MWSDGLLEGRDLITATRVGWGAWKGGGPEAYCCSLHSPRLLIVCEEGVSSGQWVVLLSDSSTLEPGGVCGGGFWPLPVSPSCHPTGESLHSTEARQEQPPILPPEDTRECNLAAAG